ncbi:SHOCT domain-containing protein [Thalassotalea euphylliae]|uniref:SHOCT domain-containing protein n=1 Tax=Thalassotalea euphylliae TaxID=1655234 RepID=UPI003640B0E0
MMKNVLANLLVLIFVGISTVSQAFQLTVDTIAELPKEINTLSDLLPITNQKDKFFAVSDSGEIYVVDLKQRNDAPLVKVFDINYLVPDAILTAMTIHPNFAIRDQDGYRKVYIAYVTKQPSQKRLLPPKSNGSDYPNTAVISEWLLDEQFIVQPNSQRVVMNIGLPNDVEGVTLLSFNPYSRVWNDDFGQLFFTLSASKNAEFAKEHPLYSGAVLRIEPSTFGLKNYTVPNDNPFVADLAIPSELWAYGLGELTGLFWLPGIKDTLIVDHTIDNSHQIDEVKEGTKNKEAIVRSQTINSLAGVHHMLRYTGNQHTYLRNKLVFADKDDSGWSIYQLSDLNDEPSLVWSFQQNEPIKLFTDHDNEVLIYQPSNGHVQRLMKVMLAGEAQASSPSAIGQSSRWWQYMLVVVAIILLALLCAIVARRYYVKKHSAKHFIAKKYVKAEFDAANQVIGFYKARQEEPESTLRYHELSSLAIYINGAQVGVVDVNASFSNDAEDKLREAFAKERTKKLSDDSWRTVSLTFVDKHSEQTELFCYFRKGSNRMTRFNYDKAQEFVVDCCWDSAAIIAPETLEKRSSVKKEEQHRSIKKFVQPPKQALETQVTVQTSASKTRTRNTVDVEGASKSTGSADSMKRDTEVVFALNQLVEMRKEGFLSEEEFEQAKAKLLKGLQ